MVRKIEYTVSESGIAPAVSQFGGVQGEHQATELVFKIANELWAKLNSLKVSKGGRLVYRIDGYDGEGGEHNSDTNNLAQSISYLLEEELTFAGGNIRVVLVITLIKDDKTEMELYSFPALLKLKNRPFGFKSENESRESMSTLAEVAKTAAEQTERDRDYVEAAEKRVEWNLAGYIPLNANLEIIFDGGDSSAKGEMFDTSVVNSILETADYVVEEGTSGIWNYHKWKSGKIEYFNNDIANKMLETADYVVEEDTSGVWTYEKWKSGKLDCWTTTTIKFTEINAFEITDGKSIYRGDVAISYPSFVGEITFSNCNPQEKPYWQGRCFATGGNVYVSIWSINPLSSNTECQISVHIKGVEKKEED